MPELTLSQISQDLLPLHIQALVIETRLDHHVPHRADTLQLSRQQDRCLGLHQNLTHRGIEYLLSPIYAPASQALDTLSLRQSLPLNSRQRLVNLLLFHSVIGSTSHRQSISFERG
jgi:hypothetical protein